MTYMYADLLMKNLNIKEKNKKKTIICSFFILDVYFKNPLKIIPT